MQSNFYNNYKSCNGYNKRINYSPFLVNPYIKYNQNMNFKNIQDIQNIKNSTPKFNSINNSVNNNQNINQKNLNNKINSNANFQNDKTNNNDNNKTNFNDKKQQNNNKQDFKDSSNPEKSSSENTSNDRLSIFGFSIDVEDLLLIGLALFLVYEDSCDLLLIIILLLVLLDNKFNFFGLNNIFDNLCNFSGLLN